METIVIGEDGNYINERTGNVLPPQPSENHWFDAAQDVWVGPELGELRVIKRDEISQACGNHIAAGFRSAALGSEYLYPAKPQDQANLVASVTDSLLAAGDTDWATPFWCADAAGVWDFRLHTITQIQQVGREGKAATLAAMSKNETLRQQIMVATAEQLNDINW